MKKSVLITLLASLGAVLVIAGLGTGVKLYQNKLNKDRAAERVASADIENLTIGYQSNITGIYPDMSYEIVSVEYASNYYEALTALDASFQIKGVLADSWENTSDNVWRFHLKSGVKFHDGSIMTADDVKASLELASKKETLSFMFPTFESATVVDPNTIDITTSAPTPLLANQLTGVFVLPAKFIEAKDYSRPDGTGPYKYVSSDENSMTLTRFNDYHGTLPKAKNVVLKSYTDDSERLAALKRGEIDVMESVENSTGVDKDDSGNKIVIENSAGIGTTDIILNTASDKLSGLSTNPFKDIRVREAMRYAIDPQKLITAGKVNSQAAATQLVAPAVFGYNNELSATKQNVEKAKTLMAEAGYSNGFSVTMDITSSATYADELKAELAEIGVNVNLNMMEASDDFFSKIMTEDTSMFYISYDCATGDALEAYAAFYGPQAYFPAVEQNQTINDLLESTSQTFDPIKRKTNLQQLAVLSNENLLVMPLFSIGYKNAHLERVTYVPRYDSMIFAQDISGAVPKNIQNNLSYLDTIKKILGINA